MNEFTNPPSLGPRKPTTRGIRVDPAVSKELGDKVKEALNEAGMAGSFDVVYPKERDYGKPAVFDYKDAMLPVGENEVFAAVRWHNGTEVIYMFDVADDRFVYKGQHKL